MSTCQSPSARSSAPTVCAAAGVTGARTSAAAAVTITVALHRLRDLLRTGHPPALARGRWPCAICATGDARVIDAHLEARQCRAQLVGDRRLRLLLIGDRGGDGALQSLQVAIQVHDDAMHAAGAGCQVVGDVLPQSIAGAGHGLHLVDAGVLRLRVPNECQLICEAALHTDALFAHGSSSYLSRASLHRATASGAHAHDAGIDLCHRR
ncbi:hypothetical protein NS354_02015 [Leucobacter chromiiresistens]|uniref:Uncharacterized protein n=1 Tax=Leucobacter chromiiresistens TaxID=1079994 RepID=A0A147ERC8_9MICO|nr:hypothetical protein NS354_02015 [Leucobacter chromiiresistens]